MGIMHQMPLKILALDTSTEACSAALLYGTQLIERYQHAPRQHTALILPMLQAVLDEAGLVLAEMDVIAFGCGPGSFTGVRIATSVTQGIAFAHNLPVIPVSTLRALAYAIHREFKFEHVLAGIDARLDEIYWGGYSYSENESMIVAIPEIVCKPAQISVPEAGSWVGAGSGWDSYNEILQKKLGDRLQQWFPHRYPRAAAIAMIAAVDYRNNKAVTADKVLPVYLRDNVVRGS